MTWLGGSMSTNRNSLMGSKKYNITMLAYYEVTPDVRSAIAREKQVKGWLRSKKIALIEAMNPAWNDLSAGWFEEASSKATGQKDPSLRSG